MKFPTIKDGIIQVDSKEDLGRYYRDLIYHDGETFISLNKLLWMSDTPYMITYQFLYKGKVPYSNKLLSGYLVKPSRFKYLSFMKEAEEIALKDRALIREGLIQEEYKTEIECLEDRGHYVNQASVR